MPLKSTAEASFIIQMAMVLHWPSKEGTYVELVCSLIDSEKNDLTPIYAGEEIKMDKEKVTQPHKPETSVVEDWEPIR